MASSKRGSTDRKRKRSAVEGHGKSDGETKVVAPPELDMPNFSDDDSSDDDDNNNKPSKKDEAPEIDAKYSLFYKRFQQAARAIPLSVYNVDQSQTTTEQVTALPMSAEDDIDAEVRAALQVKEAAVVPADLVPLPTPSSVLHATNAAAIAAAAADGDDTSSALVADQRDLKKERNEQRRLAAAAATAVPKWMSKPIHIASDIQIPFTSIEGLSPRMQKNLKLQNFVNAFAVQAAVLPPLLASGAHSLAPDVRADILVNAATGSGKTLAYSIPIIEALAKRVIPKIRALVLLPTKPLIQQVYSVMNGLAKGTSLRVTVLRSERKFKEEQHLVTTMVPDIIITTPGRLVDHIRSTPGFTLANLQYLVVDEADRLLNQSFQEWVDVVMNAIDSTTKNSDSNSTLLYENWRRSVQKLIFSATLTRDPEKMANLRIRNPQVYVVGGINADAGVDVNDRMEFMVPDTLTERLVPIKQASLKPLRLMQLLVARPGSLKYALEKAGEETAGDPQARAQAVEKQKQEDQELRSYVLVFVKSNEAAARLSRLLTLLDTEIFHSGLRIERCSGEVEASQRRKTLAAFEAGQINVLVCTDLIARGIDIAQIKHVINYDLPPGKREYVHRVGRTARAGQPGTAWTFACDYAEHKYFWAGIAERIYRKGGGQQVEKYLLEDVVEPEGTREFYRVDDGYKRALELLEDEVYTKS